MKTHWHTYAATILGLSTVLGQALAEPAVCDPFFFSEFDGPNWQLDTDNVLVGDGRFHGTFAVDNQLGITLQDVQPGLPGVATRNVFDGASGGLALSCVWVGPQAFWADFDLTQTTPNIHFDLQAAGQVVEAQRSPEWLVQWGPCGASLGNASTLSFDGSGGAQFDGFNGTVSQTRSGVDILLEGGASWLNGQVSPGAMSGQGNHFFNDVCWEASPSMAGPDLFLQDGRFQVAVDWSNGQGSGAGTAVPFTDFSGGFWFFSPNNTELLVRVLDRCDYNNHFWVFAAATTDVEYTLTIEDTNNGQIRAYRNPLGTPAAPITDTSAFATCP